MPRGWTSVHPLSHPRRDPGGRKVSPLCILDRSFSDARVPDIENTRRRICILRGLDSLPQFGEIDEIRCAVRKVDRQERLPSDAVRHRHFPRRQTAKLADALDSGSSGSNPVEVRVLFSADQPLRSLTRPRGAAAGAYSTAASRDPTMSFRLQAPVDD